MKKRIAARLGASAHAAQARDALQARAAAARARRQSASVRGKSAEKRVWEEARTGAQRPAAPLRPKRPSKGRPAPWQGAQVARCLHGRPPRGRGQHANQVRRAGPRQRPRRRGRRRQQQLHEDAPRAARRRRLGQRLERSAVLGLACHGHPLHALRRAQQHPLARRCVQQGRMRRRPEYEQRRRQRPEAPGGDRQAAQNARPGKCTNSQEKPRKLQQDLEKGGAV